MQVTQNGCLSPLSDPVVLDIEGVNRLYPVPSNGRVTFDFYIPEGASAYQVELYNSLGQLILQENNYKNYRLLLQGEETRFKNGESSLFLVNARENKTLEGLQKLQELRSKYFKTINLLSWSAGQLL